MSKHILVIEDEQSVRQNTLEMLSMEGFDVEGAANGRIGVELARDHLPDLIICDIMMPEMDGYAVLKSLREDESTALIPFIFLTARSERSDMRRGMNEGADDFLTKPFTVSELMQAVHARLDRGSAIDGATERRLDTLRHNILFSLPHELRTPLTSILGFSEVLMMDGEMMTGEEVIVMATHINKGAVRLTRLAENYLMYAQTEILRLDPNHTNELPLYEVSSVLGTVQYMADTIAERCNRAPDLNVQVEDASVRMMDEYLKKVIEELLDNAFKFSQAGQSVEVIGGVDGGRYRLSVRDHGRGMTPEQISQIGGYMQFERGYYEQQGLGLGLAIVGRLVDLHDGTIQITSQPRVGTCVTIEIPVA